MGEKIQTFNSKPSQIFSTDGKLLYEVMPIYRESISLSDVPDMVQKAFLAAEDKRFLTHSGVDPMGLGRAMFKLVRAGEAQGGAAAACCSRSKANHKGRGARWSHGGGRSCGDGEGASL
jgi:membrane carboxypeptidase/penicillin-binding protein